MKVERNHVKAVFKAYTDDYDTSDEKIKLKIDHTYRVADLCGKIAKAEGLCEEDRDLAWLLGMLHDVGRFEQLKQYGTFQDAVSVDHAAFGADILFVQGRIRDYICERKEDQLLETAIRVHSAYRIPEGLPARVEQMCHILRDADKIDILKVNVDVPLEEIYNTTTQELRSAEVTEQVMESFFGHHATLRSMKRTPVDHVVGHISLVFELVYPESVRIVKEQGYLEKLLYFSSENTKTQEQFRALREEMERYLNGKE